MRLIGEYFPETIFFFITVTGLNSYQPYIFIPYVFKSLKAISSFSNIRAQFGLPLDEAKTI